MVLLAETMLPWWLSDLGVLASIISLAVSVYVAVQVKRIAKYYRQLAMIPKLRTEVRSYLRNFEKYHANSDWFKLKAESAGFAALLTQAVTLLEGEVRRSARNAMSAADAIATSRTVLYQNEPAETVILAANRLETQLTYILEERKWR